jgi:hypothetical protein
MVKYLSFRNSSFFAFRYFLNVNLQGHLLLKRLCFHNKIIDSAHFKVTPTTTTLCSSWTLVMEIVALGKKSSLHEKV